MKEILSSIALSIFMSTMMLGLSLIACNAKADTPRISLQNNYAATYSIDVMHTDPNLVGRGTAVVLRCEKGKKVILLTSAHVVDYIKLKDGESFPPILASRGKGEGMMVRKLKVNSKLDLALLESYVASKKNCPHVTLSTTYPKLGDDLWLIGSVSTNSQRISKGIISQIKFRKGRWTYDTDADIALGYSGGGVFSKDGKLIGTVRGLMMYPYMITSNNVPLPHFKAHTPVPGGGMTIGLKTLKYFLDKNYRGL